MSMHIPFDNSFAALPPGFYTRQEATPVAAPSLIAYNNALARDLGLGAADDATLAQIFSGNMLPDGADPLAQLYAGHQFGQFNPQLGDGRALLLGEVVTAEGRFDIQLKGSGPTPYSRMGDGRAWLGPVLREYVVSEAMHALGVPTTRALAAVRTGETVYREGAMPGAILTRVASSHIRVGTFQIFAARGDKAALQTLLDHTLARHYPQANGPEGLLAEVIKAQTELIAHWMALGFIHGVMNTDNCALSGETIDYGPCAFMDAYASDMVFSSIDRMARYSYANQADIIVWNMAQLATALIPLMPDSDAAIASFTLQINAMGDAIRAAWLRRFAAKIGITNPVAEDAPLIRDLLSLMQTDGADFTNTFRSLTEDAPRDQFTNRDAFDAWERRWKTRIETEADPERTMRAANPVLIPRNHRIEQMIEAAVAGDDGPFHRLLAACAAPYIDNPDHADLRRPPTAREIVPATFCGT